MITPSNINQRIDYLNKIIKLYDNERDHLLHLLNIYEDPIYKEIRDLVEVLEPISTPTSGKIAMSEVLAKPSHDIFRHMCTVPGQRKVFQYIYRHMQPDHGNGMRINIKRDTEQARTISVSTDLLGTVVNTLIERGYLVKVPGQRSVYAISIYLHTFLMEEFNV